MKKTTLVLMLSVVAVLGLSSGALAVIDGIGDSWVGDKDLQSAEVLLYPPPGGSSHSDWVRLTVTMAGGSTMPGMITWDFDADNNAATGGGSSLNMPFPPCPPTRCKTEEGFDFYIVMVLRDQADTAQLAYCSGCVGGATCVTRGASNSCNEGTCYEPDQSCTGGPGCYVLENNDACSGSLACGNSYPLDVLCDSVVTDCADGMKWGEYYAGAGISGTNDPILRGRVILEVAVVNNLTEYCFHLPWGDIIAYASFEGAVDFASVSQNPEYQVSVWHDNVFADNNDMFDAGLILNLSDYVPNTGKASDASNGAALCLSDTNADCKVNLTDLVTSKSEFLRNNCPNCCP